MSESIPIKLQMRLSRGSDKALLVCDAPQERDAKVKTWLPKSMIDKWRTTDVVGELAIITFWLPYWLVQKNNLWEFQID